MITKSRRLAIIQELVDVHSPNSQGKLLKLLRERGFSITQTTLSRDIKQLNISKMPNDKGYYSYMNPHEDTGINKVYLKDKTTSQLNNGFISFDFSYQFGVIKTRPGYANAIALEIETYASSLVLGVIANKNTVLIIPREGASRQEISNSVEKIISGIKNY